MSIKVSSTRVIGLYISAPFLENIIDTTDSIYGRSTNDAWVSKTQTQTSIGGAGSPISFDRAGVWFGSTSFCAAGCHILLPQNQSLYFASGDANPGETANVLIDRGGSEYQLSFTSGGSGKMTIYWEDGTEPSWNDWRYWHIFGVAIDSSNIRCTAIPWGSTAATYPAGTFAGRKSTPGGSYQNVAYIFDSASTGSGTASALASGATFIQHYGSTTTIKIYKSGNPNTATWYNTSGTGAPLYTSGNPTTIWTSPNITATAVKCVKSRTGNPDVDSGWITATTGVTTTFTTAVSVNGSGGTISSSDSNFDRMAFYVRASGYADARVADFQTETYASASASCFLGDSLLTMVDESGNFLEKVTLENAHAAYHADTSTPKYVKGQDGVTNRILVFRKNDVHGPIFGFNGNDSFVTGAHPFLTTTGWKCIHGSIGNEQHANLNITDLEVGDVLIKYNSDTGEYYEEELTSIAMNRMPAVVYSLDVTGPDSDTDGNDTYIVDDYVVHNK
tara:strand:+ start:2326 stop:3837 length:1512 start_codon:yes stop_codon:yes gene_type:complete